MEALCSRTGNSNIRTTHAFDSNRKKVPHTLNYHLNFFMLVIKGMMRASTAQMVGTEKKMMQRQFQMVTPEIKNSISIHTRR
jgi:hypothetical protein